MAHCSLASVVVVLALLLPVSNFVAAEAASIVKPAQAGAYVPPEQCDAKCSYRCSETHHRKPCMFFCNKCCAECHCVPSGTYGNKDECPCYRDWKTKEGNPKCP
ncbi:hypothetical protein H6P81_020465 [Aristolochia fimbriata]|uniref:Uncharacterized protein n=1 Tax=Aristolochia fimbriata TaxID=158543 RepID=A0AAV7DUF7_ARIFI|nr:hypothetical protein H6P81_020465 [Aristolochia fimbriata]